MLARMQKSLKEKDQGFTLIELLVVIIIIGILAAIAIPVYLSQREKGVQAGIKSDLRGASTAEETYFVDNADYTNVAANLEGWKSTSGNLITLNVIPATATTPVGYCIEGSNPDTSTTYSLDSTSGAIAEVGC